MLAATLNRSTELGDSSNDTIEAGTSPVGIGGILEQFPPALYPPNRPCFADPDIERVRIEVGIDCSKVRIDPNLTFTITPTQVLKPPADPPYPIFLPTHVDHDGAVVEAASVRVRALGGTLTEAEAIAVLKVAGWPDALIPQALAVAWCESKWSPYALGDSGRSAGWFQLNIATWFQYAGEDAEHWADPVTNARVALATYRYDIGRGYRPWTQWSCGFAAHN